MSIRTDSLLRPLFVDQEGWSFYLKYIYVYASFWLNLTNFKTSLGKKHKIHGYGSSLRYRVFEHICTFEHLTYRLFLPTDCFYLQIVSTYILCLPTDCFYMHLLVIMLCLDIVNRVARGCHLALLQWLKLYTVFVLLITYKVYTNIDLKLWNKLHGPMHYKLGVTVYSLDMCSILCSYN